MNSFTTSLNVISARYKWSLCKARVTADMNTEVLWLSHADPYTIGQLSMYKSRYV